MIKVLVDCRLESGKSGGVEQAIIGISRALKESLISDIKFYWLLYESNENWLLEHLPENSVVVKVPRNSDSPKVLNRLVSKVRKIKILRRLLAFLRMHGPFKFEIEKEPDIVREIKPDLIHFPFQFGFRTQLPSIYQPHDLQHIHLQKNFTAEEIYLRNLVFSEMIKQSSLVVLGNEWTRQDFASNFPDQKTKFVNIALYPQLLNEEPNCRVIHNPYLLYPAAGWKHKNHIRLLRAFKLAIVDFPEIKLVLTGAMIKDNKFISREISKLGLTDSVVRLGFVSPSELANLYRNASGAVIPTLFESASFPVWEAFEFGVPVAVSNVTSIASQVGSGAILFDPYSEKEIYKSMCQLICDKLGNESRAEIGRQRVASLTAGNTAYGYRFYYRRALGLTIDVSDHQWESKKFVF